MIRDRKENDSMKIEKQMRSGLPQVGVRPYGQIHVHSTGNKNSTAQNEADYHMRRPINSGFFSHVVGNGRVIQTARTNAGFYDVGGGWNSWGYAAIELIESHKTKEEFMKDYKLYVELIRLLCDEAGLPKTLDQGNTGVISHAYATAHQPNNGSDHIDPYPYLRKWGISKEQFAKDIKNGLGGNSSNTDNTAKPKPNPQPSKPKITDTRDFPVGSKVKVRSKATKYQTGQPVPNFVKGKTYKVKERKTVNQSVSKYAFLVDGINSWFLAQDLDMVSSDMGNSSKPSGGLKWTTENAKATTKRVMNVRASASTNAKITGQLPKGYTIKYNAWAFDGRYTWVRYQANKGTRYMAVRDHKTGEIFATFS